MAKSVDGSGNFGTQIHNSVIDIEDVMDAESSSTVGMARQIVFVDWIERVLGIVLIDRIEGIVGIEPVDRIRGIAQDRID